MPPGDHEVRVAGDTRLTSGECAGCAGDVTEADASVIRYSYSGKRGGIFHKSCEPKGEDWYGIDGEAPDV